MTIHEEFSNPSNLETAGSVDRILLGLVNQPAQKRDVFISEELTNHLFQTPGFQFGMDLAAINIQRGRDHGIPAYVNWREPCILSPVKSWKDLERIMSPETARKFRDLYDAVEDIDLFSAGLAEKPVAGGLVGPTFACIIAQQFGHLRKGDRFWYENPFPDSGFSPAQLQEIRRVTLAQVLCRTMDDIDSVQPFVMLIPDNLRNRRLACDDPLFNQLDLGAWVDRRARGIRAGGNKPIRTKVTQHNRIFVQRPLGPHENMTIVVNNHAVNSPVFIRDSIYQSSFSNAPVPPRPQPDVPGPPTPPNPYGPPSPSNPYGSPNTLPYGLPTTPANPYQGYQDPSNPNPPAYRPSNPNASNSDYNRPPQYEQASPTTTRRPRPTPPPSAYRENDVPSSAPEGHNQQPIG